MIHEIHYLKKQEPEVVAARVAVQHQRRRYGGKHDVMHTRAAGVIAHRREMERARFRLLWQGKNSCFNKMLVKGGRELQCVLGLVCVQTI